MDRGILYVATGGKYISEAAESAKSIKNVMNNIPVTIISDREPTHPVFDNTIVREELVGDPSEASLYLNDSPYDKTIYLDTDTHILQDITDLFSILDNFDIAAAHAPNRYMKSNPDYHFDDVPECLPDYNRGVIAYNSSKEVKDFIKKWNSLYKSQSEQMVDQQPFTKVLLESNIRIATLPPEYNCRFRNSGYAKMSIKILHNRDKDLKKIGKQMNEHEKPRIFYINPFGKLVIIPKYESPFIKDRIFQLMKNGQQSIKEDGIYRTVLKLLSR